MHIHSSWLTGTTPASFNAGRREGRAKGSPEYMKLYNTEPFRLQKTFQAIVPKLWLYRGVPPPVLPSLFCCWVWEEGLLMDTGHINPHFLPPEAESSVWKLLQLQYWDPQEVHGQSAVYKQEQKANSHRKRSSQSYTCL